MAGYDLKKVAIRIESLESSLYPALPIDVRISNVKFIEDSDIFTADVKLTGKGSSIYSSCAYPLRYFKDCQYMTDSEKMIRDVDSKYLKVITELYSFESFEEGISLYNVKQHIQRLNLFRKYMNSENAPEGPVYYAHKLSNYLDDATSYINILKGES